MDVFFEDMNLVNRNEWTENHRDDYDRMIEKYNFSSDSSFNVSVDVDVDVHREYHEVYSVVVTEWTSDDSEKTIKIDFEDVKIVVEMFDSEIYPSTINHIYEEYSEYIAGFNS